MKRQSVWAKIGAVASFATSAPGVIASHALKGFFPGSGGFSGPSWFGSGLPGSRINWDKDAGQLWKNSAVGACLWYLCDTLPESPIIVQRAGSDGQKKTVAGHALTTLLARPNPAYSFKDLFAAVVLSLQVDGNGYIRIRRNMAGRIVELWYVPHWCIEPRFDDNTFISHYDYMPGGGMGTEQIAPADIIHFRMGIDPENVRKGLARLKTVLREVVSDNEASTYTAAILKNMGVPGVLISPKVGEDVQFGPNLAKTLKELWREKVVGDKRGEPVVIPGPVDVTMPGYSPEQLVLDKIRQIPEARICAVTRVPAMVAGLSVGDNQRTYSNMGEAREMAYEGTIVPLQNLLCDGLNLQLLPQMPGYTPADSCCFDLSGVRVLQEDTNELAKRVIALFNADLITREEARTLLSMISDKTRDGLYRSELMAALGMGSAGQGEQDDAEKEDAKDDATKSAWIRKSKARRAVLERFGAEA